ncbi:MAG: hypothetical protein ACE5OR_11925, partial [bacterium]
MYNVILGLQVPLDLVFDRDFWLGMQVTGDAEELSPRYRIVSVPYSFRAAVADSAVNASMLDGRTLAAFMDTSNDFGRPGVASDLYEGLTRLADRYLGKTDQAVDSDKLDGKHADAFADSAHQHDERYDTQDSLNTSDGDAPNVGSNVVHWDNLWGLPAGFADGTDDVGAAGGVSQINAGAGIEVTNPTGPTATVAHAAD